MIERLEEGDLYWGMLPPCAGERDCDLSHVAVTPHRPWQGRLAHDERSGKYYLHRFCPVCGSSDHSSNGRSLVTGPGQLYETKEAADEDYIDAMRGYVRSLQAEADRCIEEMMSAGR